MPLKTVSDLGKKLKTKHPVKFGGMSDADAGRLAKSEFPEAYLEYEEEALIVRNCAITKHEIKKIGDQGLERKIQHLWDAHDPEMGKILSLWRGYKVQGQTDFILKTTDQMRALIEQADIITEQVIKGVKRREELEFFVESNHYHIQQLKIHIVLIEEAAQKGMTVEQYEKWKFHEAQELLKIQAQEAEHKRHIDKIQTEHNLKMEEYREKFQAEIDKVITLANEELRLDMVVEFLSEQQQMTFLQDLIDEQYVKIDQIRQSKTIPEGAKPEIIESRMRIIDLFMEQQHETHRRLLEARKI